MKKGFLFSQYVKNIQIANDKDESESIDGRAMYSTMGLFAFEAMSPCIYSFI